MNLKTRTMTRAQTVREYAGLSVKDAARLARVSAQYIRRIEKSGRAPYFLARRLAMIYCCRLDDFLPKKSREEVRAAKVTR